MATDCRPHAMFKFYDTLTAEGSGSSTSRVCSRTGERCPVGAVGEIPAGGSCLYTVAAPARLWQAALCDPELVSSPTRDHERGDLLGFINLDDIFFRNRTAF